MNNKEKTCMVCGRIITDQKIKLDYAQNIKNKVII